MTKTRKCPQWYRLRFPVCLLSPMTRRTFRPGLGRNHMKILAVALLFGAALLTALPVAADGIPHLGFGKGSSGILLANSFDGGNNVDLSDSRSFLVANAFLSELKDDKFRRDGMIDWNIEKLGSFVLPDWKGWSIGDRGRDWNEGCNKEDLGGVPVPEPGTITLLLFGLGAVGFLRPRRTAWARTT